MGQPSIYHATVALSFQIEICNLDRTISSFLATSLYKKVIFTKNWVTRSCRPSDVMHWHVSGQLPTRTISHRTCISPDEWFYWFVVVLVGRYPSGELSKGLWSRWAIDGFYFYPMGNCPRTALTSLCCHVGGRSHCLVRACDLLLAHHWQLRLRVIVYPPSEGAMRLWCHMHKVYGGGGQGGGVHFASNTFPNVFLIVKIQMCLMLS